MYNQKFMKLAIEEAKTALNEEEVPIGAVIVKNNQVISTGYNQKNGSNFVTKHAEIIAIEKANQILNNWRLIDCDIYITLEPCPMCMSAIQQARIKNVFYGISNRDLNNEKIIKEIAKKNQTNPEVLLHHGYMISEIENLMNKFFLKHR